MKFGRPPERVDLPDDGATLRYEKCRSERVVILTVVREGCFACRIERHIACVEIRASWACCLGLIEPH